MKVVLQMILLTGLLLTLKAWANDPNYDSNTGVVHFPRVTVDNSEALINVDLLLSQDGTWEVLDFESEPKSLTGDWSGNTVGTIWIGFSPGMTCDSELFEVSLTQNGNEVIGNATFSDGCHVGQSGIITGLVRGNYFSFSLTFEDETVMKFEGAIAHDLCALGGIYRYRLMDEEGFWALSC